jgi:DNA mismatch repair protein MutL
LQHALSEAYRGILLGGRFPIAFLQIEMSPEMFDVNVHPTKMEVRFLDSNRIYSDFLGVIREKFLNSDLRSRFHAGSSDKTVPPTETVQPLHEQPYNYDNVILHDPNDPRAALNSSTTENTRKNMSDWVEQLRRDKTNAESGKIPNSITSPEFGVSDSEASDFDTPNFDESGLEMFDSVKSGLEVSGSRHGLSNILSGKELSFHAIPDRPTPPEQTNQEEKQPTSLINDNHDNNDNNNENDENDVKDSFLNNLSALFSERVAYSPQGKLVVQMHNRYLVMETATGVALIDQHALHERVLYERLKERMSEGQLESQRLLVPIPVDLSPNESACVLEHLEFFKTLGLEVEPFGGETMLISAFPAILSKTPPAEILMSVLEPLLETGKKLNQTEMFEEMLHSMACKAAIKAGDQLRSDAISRLIALAEKEVNAHHCPHGRPSILVFSCEELDKMFKRT